jgi:hypothetical protein
MSQNKEQNQQTQSEKSLNFTPDVNKSYATEYVTVRNKQNKKNKNVSNLSTNLSVSMLHTAQEGSS